jgi:hypothetical protein
MAIKYAKHFAPQGPPKFTQSGIIGLKINHLATLLWATPPEASSRKIEAWLFVRA